MKKKENRNISQILRGITMRRIGEFALIIILLVIMIVFAKFTDDKEKIIKSVDFSNIAILGRRISGYTYKIVEEKHKKTDNILEALNAYQKYIDENGSEDDYYDSGCALVYIDKDIIPECYYVDTSRGDWGMVLQYKNGQIYSGGGLNCSHAKYQKYNNKISFHGSDGCFSKDSFCEISDEGGIGMLGYAKWGAYSPEINDYVIVDVRDWTEKATYVGKTGVDIEYVVMEELYDSDAWREVDRGNYEEFLNSFGSFEKMPMLLRPSQLDFQLIYCLSRN